MDAPATNAAADASDDLPPGEPDAYPSASAAAVDRAQPDSRGGDDRDAWIRAQRPPHWD